MYQAYQTTEYLCRDVERTSPVWDSAAVFGDNKKIRAKKQTAKLAAKKRCLFAVITWVGFGLIMCAVATHNIAVTVIFGGLGCFLFYAGLTPWKYSSTQKSNN